MCADSKAPGNPRARRRNSSAVICVLFGSGRVLNTANTSSPARPESIGRARPECFARPQHDRWEVAMVDRVGKMIRLEAKAAVLSVNHAADAGEFSVQAIAREELDARLGGPDFHDPPRLRLLDARAEGKFIAGAVQDKIV